MTVDLANQITYSISLLICFVGVFSICDGALSIAGFSETFSFPWAVLNRKVGGALGLTRGYVITLIFLTIFAFHLYKAGNIGGDFLSGSFFANLFANQARELDELISSQRPENYQKVYQHQPYNEKEFYQNFPAQNYYMGSHPMLGSGVVAPAPAPAPTPAPRYVPAP